ncbi:MAG: hypothetical protein H6641_09480 [Caldilineaceae bacterium]|nr:hypothetical protein [Caldilineaceae bacterium]
MKKGQRDIASFLVRFTQDLWDDVPGEPRVEWRGHIRHVQSGKEHNFTDFTDAMAFIQQSLMDLTLNSTKGKATFSQPSAAKAGAEAAARQETYQQKALRESFKLWDKFTSSYSTMMMEAMQQAADRSIQHTEALRAQFDKTLEQTQNVSFWQPWWFTPPFAPPTTPPKSENTEQQLVQVLTALQQQIAALGEKVESLEGEIEALNKNQ